jgi:hypothetical protein
MSITDFYEEMERQDLAIPDRLSHNVLHKWPLARVIDTALHLAGLLPLHPPGLDVAAVLDVLPDRVTCGGMCHNPECREAAARELGAFAGMYCDAAYVVSPLHRTLLDFDDGSARTAEKLLRDSLAGDLLSLLILRPLVESGVIRYIKPDLTLCPECTERMLPASARRAVHEVADAVVDRFLQRCTLSVRRFRSHQTLPYELAVTGADDFFPPHGALCRWSPASYIPKQLRDACDSGQTLTLSSQQARSLGIAHRLIGEMIEELIFCLYASKLHNVRYLTQRNADQYFLQAVSAEGSDELLRAQAARLLTHELPMLKRIDMGRIVSIRRREADTFIAYRQALSKAMGEVLTSSDPPSRNDAIQLYRDVLRPEVDKIEARFRRSRRQQFVAAGTTALVYTGVMAISIATGVLPPTATALLGLVGGAESVNTIVKAVGTSLAPPEPLRANDFYFLWRVGRSR